MTDEVLQEAAKYCGSNPEEKGKAVSLMKAARQMSSGAASMSTARDGQ